MKSAAENIFDHSKNRLDTVNMEAIKNSKAIVKDNLLSKQFQNLILPNLEEITIKADRLKIDDFEASGLEINIKYQDNNPQVPEPQQINTKETIWDKLWLFTAKRYITAVIQFFVYCCTRYLP